MNLSLRPLFLLHLVLALSACGGGGGGGGSTSAPTPPAAPTLTLPAHGLTAAQLGLVVISGDAASEAMATYYAQARGVPAANVVRVSLPAGATTSASLNLAAFQQFKATVDAALPAGVQAVLLVWKLPAQVNGATCSMSITSAMAFGFDAKYCGGCPATAASAYYDSEATLPFTQVGLRPAMLLGTATLDEAKALIDRGVQADNSQPTGTGWLLRTSDADRSVRYTDFSALPAAWSAQLALNYQDNSTGASSDAITGKSNVLFYFTGLAGVPGLATNTYRAGAIGDSLTSFAGVLDGTAGQTTASDWIAAGLTASYGTVEEPCNWQGKFPRASVLIDHYNRGDTLIEAYWKSVQMPGQGLFVGEPLARPWPDVPSLSVSGSQYSLKTRGLRPGSLYTLQYRRPADADWSGLAFFTGQRGVTTLSSALPPSEATQLRWQGPCTTDSSKTCTLAQTAN